jgi:hypothetical protein
MIWSSKSSCEVRDCLKPTVLVLAILSATTAWRVIDDTIPDSAV